ncbi:MAG: DUF4422 domain-containing protein [Verrucomicrobiae bacterium]|nr:DUF4422 domain-containing protein [Verrucomicrobiae bacterium]
MKHWKIFIHCHNAIFPEMYANDPDFSAEHYTFLRLGQHSLDCPAGKDYQVISERDFPHHWDDPNYAELTGLYCVYRNGLYNSLDYVGFSHYDKEHRLLSASASFDIDKLEKARYTHEVARKPSKTPTDVTARISNIIAAHSQVHISLESHKFEKIYRQRVLMDPVHPNRFVGDGPNCIDRILADYNEYYNTHYTLADVARDGFLNMCNCFVTPVELFEKLMKFITPIMESRRLEIFDTGRKHRLQGGLLERYVAVFFALENIPKVDLSLLHQYWRKKTAKRRPSILRFWRRA